MMNEKASKKLVIFCLVLISLWGSVLADHPRFAAEIVGLAALLIIPLPIFLWGIALFFRRW